MTTIVSRDNITKLVDTSETTSIDSINTPTILRVIDNSSIVLAKENVTNILIDTIIGPEGAPGIQGQQGQQGIQGEPGVLEEEVPQAKRTDFIDSEILYRGEAIPGSVDTDAVWRIRKITISAIDGDVREMWADGTADYIKTWNNRLTYTYT